MVVVSNTLIDHFIYKCCFIVMNFYAAIILCELYHVIHMNSLIISFFFVFQSMR